MSSNKDFGIDWEYTEEVFRESFSRIKAFFKRKKRCSIVNCEKKANKTIGYGSFCDEHFKKQIDAWNNSETCHVCGKIKGVCKHKFVKM